MVSPRKAASSVNLSTDDYAANGNGNKLTPSSRKSCESIYSATSSYGSAAILYRRRLPANFGLRQPALIPATNEVRQRVISARRLRLRNVQNQLGVAQRTITELSNELRVLRILHKRQNSALAKYESTNAELPRLLNAHAEELRVWQVKYRNLQATHKDLEQKIKQKEAIILSLSDENKYYSQLNKDKNLEDRQRLAEKLHTLEQRLQEKENQMKITERKAHLEIKNVKQQVLAEQRKTKDVLLKLEKARLELSSYRKLEELNLTEKLSGLTLKQHSSKAESKPSSKKINKEKHHENAAVSSSKTPSPMHAAINSDPDDSDYLMSHRSQRSLHSNTNIDFTSTRTIRKISTTSSTNKKHRREAQDVSIAHEDIIGDGPDQSRKQKALSQKHKSSANQIKMMVDMPSFNGACDDAEKADDVVIMGADDTMESNGGYDYADDFDAQEEHAYLSPDEENENLNVKYGISATTFNEAGSDDDEVKAQPARIKEDIMNIRKQISDDYKEREAFLDTFCRQATAAGPHGNDANAAAINKQGTSSSQPAANRKHKLLAALKAIDDDQRSNHD